MWTYVKAWTVVVALMCSLLTMVPVARRHQGAPDAQAFLVKDINAALDTAAASSPARFVQVRGALLFSATYWLWGTDGIPADTTLVKAIGVSKLTNVNPTLFFRSGNHPSLATFERRPPQGRSHSVGASSLADGLKTCHEVRQPGWRIQGPRMGWGRDRRAAPAPPESGGWPASTWLPSGA